MTFTYIHIYLRTTCRRGDFWAQKMIIVNYLLFCSSHYISLAAGKGSLKGSVGSNKHLCLPKLSQVNLVVFSS